METDEIILIYFIIKNSFSSINGRIRHLRDALLPCSSAAVRAECRPTAKSSCGKRYIQLITIFNFICYQGEAYYGPF